MAKPKSVFVSYARRDKEAARSLIDELRRSGFSVLGDPEELKTAKDWQKATEDAIQSADAVIVLLGSEAAPSKYQELEWSCTLESYWADRTKSLIPVLVGDAALPSFLSRFQALHLPDAASGWSVVIHALQTQEGVPITKLQNMAKLGERLQVVENFAESLKKDKTPG